ncbi:hypothetical protein EGH21_20940 [Halomicroarcula sp. F13]|uniref:DUF7343 domain-containing protein n=1 Tax=Haloarcula rubra TaxID=2487747 RepID=A0AAW4PYZ8_9EURY|nr:hypothetical protein [Halomicroarcula rubra]MBX0325498.1 hypothetical protein [Halomicroarcula rubra]
MGRSFWQFTSNLLQILSGLLWGWVLVGVLLGSAVVLSAFGVEDVHGDLLQRIDSDDSARQFSPEALPDVSPEAVTDAKGRFSASTFERVTGMRPAAFVHLFVESKGGRVRQQTIITCLPWSKTTVGRLLDTLEEEGLLVRVSTGRENVVCTPAEAPDSES